MFGDMAFEMTRTYNGKTFCLREHLVRLYNSLKMMQIDPGMSIDEMERLTLETLEKNKPTEAAGGGQKSLSTASVSRSISSI